MLSTNGSIITNGGASLLADALSRGVPIQFTTMKIGSGELLSGDTPEAFTDIKNIWKDIGITSVSKTESIVRIRGVFSNDALETTQWVREVGVYAKTDQVAETLFCYVNDGNGEELPAGTGGNLIERVRDILSDVSNATVKTILDPSQVYATIYDLNDKIKAADHTMKVDDSGLSANHHYILGNVFRGIIEEVTDIVADKVFFSSNTKQYYRANKTASGTWTGPDSADFQEISNVELIKLINESKAKENIILHNEATDPLTMQDNASSYLDLRKDAVSGKNYVCINPSGSVAVSHPTSSFELESVHNNREKIESLSQEGRAETTGTKTSSLGKFDFNYTVRFEKLGKQKRATVTGVITRKGTGADGFNPSNTITIPTGFENTVTQENSGVVSGSNIEGDATFELLVIGNNVILANGNSSTAVNGGVYVRGFIIYE